MPDAVTTPVGGRVTALTKFVAATKYLDGAVIALFSNDITPNKLTPLSAFTEVTFTGYARSAAVVWGTPGYDPSGVPTVKAPSVQFTQTGVVATGTARGWYMIGDPAGTPYLIDSGRFPVAVVFDRVGRLVTVDPEFPLPDDAGGIVVHARGQLAALANLIGVGGYLTGAKLKLFKNNLSPTPLNVLADFTEADFTGYAASGTLTWGSTYLDENDNATIGGGEPVFVQSGLTTINDVYGAYIVGDPAGTPYLVAAWRFPVPVTMAEVNKGLPVPVVYQLPA